MVCPVSCFCCQSCNCLSFCPVKQEVLSSSTTVSQLDSTPVVSHTPQQPPALCLPNVVAGYSDGTVRMFDLNTVEMVLKIHPHAVAVTAICFSSNGGRMWSLVHSLSGIALYRL